MKSKDKVFRNLMFYTTLPIRKADKGIESLEGVCNIRIRNHNNISTGF